MMYGNAIWKSGIGEIPKASGGSAPGTRRGGLAVPHVGTYNQLQNIWD